MKYLLKMTKGEALAVVYVNELLVSVDLEDCGFDAEQISYVLKKLPSTETAFAKWVHSSDKVLSCTPEEMDVPFEQFWKAYPLKTGKKECSEYWNKKMNLADHCEAWVGLKRYLKHLHRNQWQSPIYPIRFLKKERYNDEEF